MSKIGRMNYALQEYAEDLGYSTVQDALDNGYHVVEDLVSGEYKLERIDIAGELEQAHQAWLKERDEVLNGLDIVAHSDTVPFEHKEIVKQAYNFMKEQCHD